MKLCEGILEPHNNIWYRVAPTLLCVVASKYTHQLNVVIRRY